MSLRFSGGQQLQRGRGIGGLLRFMKSVFAPIVKNVSKGVVSAAKSEGGKKLLNVLKEQAVSSTMNLAADTLSGSNVKDSFKNEFENLKQTVASTINDINKLKRKQHPSQEGQGVGRRKYQLKRPKLNKKNRDFFD